MSEVKMMDFFKLPANELVKKIDQNKASVLNCDGVSEFQAIDVAVSAYDANQALIKKQQEQIDALCGALVSSNQRLLAIFKNTGSLGANAQYEANLKVLEQPWSAS
tara:strand:+ start:1300 stop:1617 length:318 start_codon:yes stop_codon:yes gene_type:complete